MNNHNGVNKDENKTTVKDKVKAVTSKQSRSDGARMREQDADLLESMHYAASQVSQYSPNVRPSSRPNDRSLPMEDLPLLSMTVGSTHDFLMDHHRKPNLKVNNIISRQEEIKVPNSRRLSSTCSSHFDFDCILQGNFTGKTLTKSVRGKSSTDIFDSKKNHETKESPLNNNRPQIRRLLSGDFRSNSWLNDLENSITLKPDEINLNNYVSSSKMTQLQSLKENEPQEAAEDDIITVCDDIINPINFSAHRRRVSEAMQFAQAVGEQISINQGEDLCIIDDDDDDDDDDDYDDAEKESNDNSAIVGPDNVLNFSHKNLLSERLTDHSICYIPQKTKRTGPIILNPDLPGTSRSPLPSFLDSHRRKHRPIWPFRQHTDVEFGFIGYLSDGVGDRIDFEYKGICANPPEITKRGMQRGNYAQLHRKAWLEVSDKYHRYGKNLRLYYRYWERLGFPTNQFFDWLDSKGEAAGHPLPNIEECPRSVLDSDTVLYIINPNVTERYAIHIVVQEDGRGLVVDVDNDPVITGSDGWIFILRDNKMYGAQKVTSISGHSKQRFHHSSFFGGKAVASAGIIITDDEGYMIKMYPHSGHYRPGEVHVQRMLYFLHKKNVDLRTFEMDTQQISHVSREKDDKKANSLKKMKKVDTLHLERAVDVACFLAHKADFIGKGIFGKIHRIRNADVTTVTEALSLIEDNRERKEY